MDNSELVGRLLARWPEDAAQTWETSNGSWIPGLVNPDGPKAATYIATLEARLAAVEGALEQARGHLDGSSEEMLDLDVMIDLALGVIEQALGASL